MIRLKKNECCHLRLVGREGGINSNGSANNKSCFLIRTRTWTKMRTTTLCYVLILLSTVVSKSSASYEIDQARVQKVLTFLKNYGEPQREEGWVRRHCVWLRWAHAKGLVAAAIFLANLLDLLCLNSFYLMVWSEVFVNSCVSMKKKVIYSS